MRARVGRMWAAAPGPLRLASAALAAGAAIDILAVLLDFAVTAEDKTAVAALLLTATGLLVMALAVALLSGSRVAWLLTVVLLVAGLTAEPLETAPVSLAYIASTGLALVLLLVPGTLRAVWQHRSPSRQPQDGAART